MTVQTKKSKFAPIDLLVEDLTTSVKLNPLKSKYLDQWTLSQQREAAGLLPHFFLSAWYDIEGDLKNGDKAPVISVEELFTKLKTGVENKYQFGASFNNNGYDQKGTLDDKGVYKYPSDPVLKPLVTLNIHAWDYENNEYVPVISCHIYLAALIAIRNQVSGEWALTRMD
jgi:hypothetical protein